ncbi:hypothetical protein [Kitasatospora sp. NPDC093806]|uniref:hypothetical protein n=1 Tax=Kitasatospora sp. NPDC093806 TaxID=3155075 RepID=UPI0034383703
MDPLGASAVITASTTVAAQVTAAACQYLRLRWELRQELAHRQALEALLRSLPEGSTVTITLPRGSR